MILKNAISCQEGGVRIVGIIPNDGEGYTMRSEPDGIELSSYWKTAIGLQDVDGLTPSEYLVQTANANIEGKITLKEAEKLITEYYEQKSVRNDKSRSEEADKVSLRITGLLSEKTFNLSPVGLISIHKRLFDGIYEFAGKIRDYDISKNEWVLGGKTVIYASAYDLRETLDYDFAREKNFNYAKLGVRAKVDHLIKFISGLWQIHAFSEGNTRTIAVFAIKYLRTFGYDITNDIFEKHSRYFRNALVRTNYNDNKNGISATYEYLYRFFGNLLFDEHNELHNRELHISAVKIL